MRFQLPNGKWSDELTDPSKVSLDEAAYLVARHMYSNAKATEEGLMYFGGTGFALRYIWDENVVSIPDSFFKNTARIIRKNGFVPVSNKLGKGWLVPPQFPTWNSGQSYSTLGGEPVYDDGSTTDAGPVTHLRITEKMRSLYVTIAANEGRKASEYRDALGFNPKSAAATLIKHGFIERRGKTVAVRYYTTKKVLPLKRVNGGGKQVVVVQRKPEDFKGLPEIKPNAERVAEISQTQVRMHEALTNPVPKLYQLKAGLYQIIDGKPVRVEVEEVV